MIEFVAIVSRRPRTLGVCDRGVADSLAGREDVRRAMEFVRRTSTGAPSDSTPPGGGPRSLLRSVQRVLRGRATVPVVSLDSTNLSGFRLDQADLRGMSFVDACLHGTVFSDASLQGSRFNGAQADSAVFTRARLDSSQFASATLAGAVFFAACLRHADFSGANLTYARFVQSDVSWVNFFGATLEGAEGWSETDQSRTNALFLDVKGLTPTDSGAIVAAGGILHGTDFPAWEERRKAARPMVSTVAACQPETQSSN
jgi:uncharacterized protein YjbI with pentapeptide repeats